MAIKQYSLAKDGARQLSPAFKVREFRCRDGSDVVMIDESLVVLLQCIREHFGKPITITSGYRTAAHNAAVGGAKSSQHLLGRAADIQVQGASASRTWPPTPKACCPAGAAWAATRSRQAAPRAGCMWTPGRTRAGGRCEGDDVLKDYFCMAVGALGAAFASLFGGWDAALQTLIIFMAIDYITGLIVAGVFHASPKTKSGTLESRAGWKGLCRKGETLLIVLVACRLDAVMGSTFVRDAVVIGFICNETISIIENAGLMGLPIPAVITKAVDILKQRSETEQKG